MARIAELDRVVLTKDIPEHGLKAGDIGTAVHVYAKGAGYEVEFCTLAGRTIAVVTLDRSQVRGIKAREMAHARTAPAPGRTRKAANGRPRVASNRRPAWE